MKALYYGDNLQVLRDSIASESVDVIYLDPPFNSNATYNVGLLGESGRDRMRGPTAACSHERTLASPKAVNHWSLTSLRERLIKIGAKVVGHACLIIFRLAEVAVPRSLWQDMLTGIAGLKLVEQPP